MKLELTERAEIDIICFMWRRIEEVITGLTRNQFERDLTRVRIPPAAPKKGGTQRVPPFFGAQPFASGKRLPLRRVDRDPAGGPRSLRRHPPPCGIAVLLLRSISTAYPSSKIPAAAPFPASPKTALRRGSLRYRPTRSTGLGADRGRGRGAAFSEGRSP